MEGYPLPETIGDYTIEGRIAGGGMGDILLGTKRGAEGFQKRVAIKVVLPQFLEKDSHRQMFFHEARIAARMAHTNVCQVFDFGEEKGLHYLVMEHLSGVTFSQMIRAHRERSKRMAPQLAAMVVAGAARGLHHAHTLKDDDGVALGVVHRDISPGNIFVTWDGCPKVLDFGIALSEERSNVTGSGIRGKPGYLAPEQVEKAALDARTDQFSLGVVLYEAVIGERLFKARSLRESVEAVLGDPIPDPRGVLPELPAAYADVLRASLSRAPHDRYESAEAMARALDSVITAHYPGTTTAGLVDTLENLFPVAQRTTPATTSSVPRDPARSRAPWVAAAAAAIGLVVGLVVALSPGERRPSAPDDPPSVPAVASPQPALESTPVGSPEAAVPPEKPAHRPRPRRKRPPPPVHDAAPAAQPAAEVPKKTGALTVLAEPYGQVRIDGKTVGTTPLMRYELAAGPHLVELVAPDTGAVRERRNIEVEPGEHERITVR